MCKIIILIEHQNKSNERITFSNLQDSGGYYARTTKKPEPTCKETAIFNPNNYSSNFCEGVDEFADEVNYVLFCLVSVYLVLYTQGPVVSKQFC